MTNAEMLAKDTKLMMHTVAGLCVEVGGKCRNCPLRHIDCNNEEVIEEWLKEEADVIEEIIL